MRGDAYSWLVSLLTGDAEGGYKAMDAAAGEVPAGSEGVQAILGSVRTRVQQSGNEGREALYFRCLWR